MQRQHCADERLPIVAEFPTGGSHSGGQRDFEFLLGVAKPDERIFRKALQITQRRPDECLFIDDRPANVAAARRLGIPSVRFTNLAELRPALLALGVETP